jgi:glycosyltransferase involved in cell wall biosynthesis
MHGEIKMRKEGLRTRDGHMLEWIPQLDSRIDIHVRSRPEPWPRVSLARRRGTDLPVSWTLETREVLAAPPLPRSRHGWWLRALDHETPWPIADAALIWNPLQAVTSEFARFRGGIVVDLLDDWSHHTAFASFRDEVEAAYGKLFARADAIFANSEGTEELAQRFGRTDVTLLRNGCDPERFTAAVEPHEQFTVGYGGKIGHRLDVGLVREVAGHFPDWLFEFVGPVLMKQTGAELEAIPNVRLAGDVHYSKYPERFKRWDLAWVPHALGPNEVGGDVIKIYEYRAAGLPVLSTAIIGSDRALPGVTIIDTQSAPAVMAAFDNAGVPGAVERDSYATPAEDTWRHKAGVVATAIRNSARTGSA